MQAAFPAPPQPSGAPDAADLQGTTEGEPAAQEGQEGEDVQKHAATDVEQIPRAGPHAPSRQHSQKSGAVSPFQDASGADSPAHSAHSVLGTSTR